MVQPLLSTTLKFVVSLKPSLPSQISVPGNPRDEWYVLLDLKQDQLLRRTEERGWEEYKL